MSAHSPSNMRAKTTRLKGCAKRATSSAATGAPTKPMEILQRVRATIRERGLLPPEGGVVIVGYSGGADSTALLHLMTRLQEEFHLQIHAAHLHHGMRPEADADVEVCRAVCERLGIPLHVERVDVPALAKARKVSLEEAGRDARYAFFERLAAELNAVAVALAHTQDDQIETILINLLRGTGPRGLCGMPYRRDRIIRPLLDATREQTHRYCAEQNLPTVFDSTNLDPHQMRRRVRAELIPLMRSMAPAFENHLLRLAAILEDEEAWWDHQVQEVLKAIYASPQSLARAEWGEPTRLQTPAYVAEAEGIGRGSVARIPRLSFTRLHPALQRRLLREWLRPHLGTLNLPPFEILEGIRGAALRGQRTSWQLSDRLRLTTDENALTLHEDRSEPESFEYPVVLGTPLFIPQAGAWLLIREISVPGGLSEVVSCGDAQSLEVCFDADAVRGQLVVRNGRRGERFQPLGMTAPKKLSDIFIDRKIPKAQRRRQPLLCDEVGILWIPGYTIAARARITPQTRRVLQATLSRNALEG
ncbi:MAG: tRNA lysidine(34) synthetase TilS [Armatimonadetes bacterium CP1_7O]|nr:MAG: tRNA lysidine(34) synthetase TilS [Armatimonadetes bacterium CP1_7O]